MQARRPQDSQAGPEICGACFYLCILRGSRRRLSLYLFLTCVFCGFTPQPAPVLFYVIAGLTPDMHPFFYVFAGLTSDLPGRGIYRYKADHRSLIERQRRWG
jgi:hypothetical protein